MKTRTLLAAPLALLALAPAAQAATVTEKYTTITRVNGTDPADCNKLRILKIGPSTAKNVVVLVPGFLGGSGDFRVIGKRLVPALKNKVQVWGIDRRSQCLEDTTGFVGTTATQGLGYYLLGQQVNGKSFVAPKSGDPGVEAARKWGLKTTIDDIRAVVLEAKKGSRKVVLGGHSLGGSLTSIYSTWEFGSTTGKTPGYKDVVGLVLIDGAARGTFGTQPDPATVNANIAALATGLPFSSLLPGIPTYYQGVFPELAAKYAIEAPKSNSALQSVLGNFPALASFTTSTRLNNEAQLGYAFDRDSSPASVSLLHMNMGSPKPSTVPGGASSWQNGGLTDIADVKTLFGTEPGNFVEWFFPQRLSIEVGAATTLTRSSLTDSLGLKPWNLSNVNVPLYAFETGLTCDGRPSPKASNYSAWINSNKSTKCRVLTGATSLDTASKITRATYVADHDQEHLDPLVARASSNKFQSTLTTFLKSTFRIR